MKIRVDSHMHTLASGHAYNSPLEMIEAASKIKDLEMIVLTDHGPAMEGASSQIYFLNLEAIPRELFGIKVLKGVEANIVDVNGNIDLIKSIAERLDFVLAGFHFPSYMPNDNIKTNTKALVNILKNPLVDAISHPGNAKYPIDIETVVKTAKEENKALEINNHSFFVREGSDANCIEIARKCKEHGVFIVCGSDAHFHLDIGKFDNILNILKQVDFPEELVLNTSSDKFLEFLKTRRKK